MASSTVILSKLVELAEHALVFAACLIFIAGIGIGLACLLCWLEHRLRKSHHLRQVFRALHFTAFVLLLGDCGLLLICCVYAVTKTVGLS